MCRFAPSFFTDGMRLVYRRPKAKKRTYTYPEVRVQKNKSLATGVCPKNSCCVALKNRNISTLGNLDTSGILIYDLIHLLPDLLQISPVFTDNVQCVPDNLGRKIFNL